MDNFLTKMYHLLWFPWLTFVMISSWTILLRHKDMCNTALSVNNLKSWSYLTERLHFLIHVVRVTCAFIVLLGMETELKSRIQAAVSVNKRRFIDPSSDINLDLTYICDRLVAMAIPCSHAVIYRNDIREVSRFFSTRHYSRFLIFNLCEDHEESGNGNYDSNYFFGQVRRKIQQPQKRAYWLIRSRVLTLNVVPVIAGMLPISECAVLPSSGAETSVL